MVSTRSVRYKFSEGERVLCYEPDPTKAKVLYDSKVCVQNIMMYFFYTLPICNHFINMHLKRIC